MGTKIRALAVFTSLLLAKSAVGATIYDSNGFDSTSRFPAGPLAGSDGLKWQRAFGGSESATITNSALAQSASQMLVLTHVNSTDFWFPGQSQFNPSGTTSIVVEEADFRLPTQTTSGHAVYGLEIFDSNGDSVAMAGLDAANGHLMTRGSDLKLIDLGTSFTASNDTWYHIQLRADYSGAIGNRKFSILAGPSSGTLTTVDSNRPFVTSGAIDFSDGDIVLTSNPDAASTTGVGYLDNFKISAVPEPTAVGVLAMAAVGLLARRRVRA